MSDTEPKTCSQCGAHLGSGQCPACQPGPSLDAAETLAVPRDPVAPDQTLVPQLEPPQPPSSETVVPAAETVIGQPPAPPSEPAAPAAPAVPPSSALAPESTVEKQIGPYTVGQRLGDGGMGEVFIAEQQEPVKRQVALKIIKLGMDSTEVLRRFEAERQALAMMDHPNIAHVYDAGTAPSGRPYFVMELVRGIPLTDYCDRNRLTPAERLELFVTVCEAIQHAHQRGIIHRDLKPSNILVEEVDGVPTPKVIDFGIAKAVDQDLTESTLETQIGDLLGTPQYMSPEQALGNIQEIDTRSDVYSLGVILYELLTGEPPISAGEIQEAGILGVGKLLSERDPQRPSTRLISRGKEARTVAEQRGTDPSQLSRSLKRELDWVTLKCLEKERDRRYDTASALAQDLERHLNDRVVEARPPSAGYRFRKMVRRNRVAFSAATVVLLAILAGAGLAVWQAIEATQAQQETAELLAESYAENGWDALEKGDASLSLLWQAEALQAVTQGSALKAEEQLPFRQSLAWSLEFAPKPVAVFERPHRVWPSSMWHDAETDRLFLAIQGHGVEVWDLETQSLLQHSAKYKPAGSGNPPVDPVKRRFVFRGNTVRSFSFEDPETPLWETVAEDRPGFAIVGLAYSYDFKYLVALSNSLVATVLDSDTGEVVRRIDLGDGTKKNGVRLRVSDSTYRLTTFARNLNFGPGRNWVNVADFETGEILIPTTERPNFSNTAAFSPDGRTLVLAENRGELVLYDGDAGEEVPSRLRFWTGNNPGTVLFDGTGHHVYSLNFGTISAWRWPEQDHLFYARPNYSGVIFETGRDRYLLTAWGSKAGRLDARSGEVISILPETPGRGYAWRSSEGSLAWTAWQLDWEGEEPKTRITIWKTASSYGPQPHPLRYEFGKGGGNLKNTASLDPGSNRFFSYLGEGACVWDVESGDVLFNHGDFGGKNVLSATLMTGGDQVAVGNSEGAIEVVDVDTGETRHSFSQEGEVRYLKGSPGGTWLVAKDSFLDPDLGKGHRTGKAFHFWRFPEGELAHTVQAQAHSEASTCRVEFSPDDRFAVIRTGDGSRTASKKNEVTLLDLETGKTWHYVSDREQGLELNWDPWANNGPGDQFAFLSDRLFLMRRMVWRLDEESGMERVAHLRDTPGIDGDEPVAAFSGGERVILRDLSRQSFRIWDVASGEPVSPPIQTGGFVTSLAAHPNGRTIASGGEEGSIRLWDGPTGKPVSPSLESPHLKRVIRLFFSEDGRRLISVSMSGESLLWKIPEPVVESSGDLVRAARQVARRRLGGGGRVQELSPEMVMENWERNELSSLTRSPLPNPSPEESWSPLFTGPILDGWENEHAHLDDQSFRFQGELLKVSREDRGDRRLKFVGREDLDPEFRDFRLRTLVWADEEARAHLFFHANLDAKGNPETGLVFRIQGIPTGNEHTGTLNNLRRVFNPLVFRPEQWHELELEVRGKQVIVRIDGTTVSWWREPEDWVREGGNPNRTLGSGTFIIRAERGTIYFRDMKIQPLDGAE